MPYFNITKPHLYLFSALLVACFCCSCITQNRYKAAIVYGKKNSYNIRRLSIDTESVSITNIKNKFGKTRMISNSGYQGKLYYTDMIGTRIDTALLFQILRNVIGSNDIKKMAKNPYSDIGIYMIFSTDGDVLEISFLTNKSTLITPNMFEQIEMQIKQKIQAIFNERTDPNFKNMAPYKTYNFIRYHMNVRYKKLLVN